MNKQMKCRPMQVLSHVLVLLWMVVIFTFSNQPGDVSADLSGSISHIFMQVWNWLFQLGWNDIEVLQMTARWDYPIRKLAHMTEFGILAVLQYWGLSYYSKIKQRYWKIKSSQMPYVVAWSIAVFYAITDEFHQLFVPDRDGNLFDVGVDACGAAIALLLLWCIKRLLQKIFGHKKQL